jgi:hypothetical protein
MSTKNLIVLTPFVILTFILGACSGTSSKTNSSANTTVTQGAQAGTSLSKVNMLLVGTLKLEDTGQAVTTDEAVKLLPLWQAYRSLSTSQTAAEAEVVALLNQIQSTMTTDQVEAIKAMNLTSSDMMTLMQSMGRGGSQGTPNPQSTPGINIPSGGFPSGNPLSGSAGGSPSGSNSGSTRNFPSGGGAVIVGGGPGGDAGSTVGLGGGPMLQGTQDPSMQATAQARFSTQASQVNSILLEVLITKLETKTAG